MAGISESVISSKYKAQIKAGLCMLLCLLPIISVQAQQRIYLSAADFIQQGFAQTGCEEKSLWLAKVDKLRIEKLIQRSYSKLRQHYCLHAGRSAWVLDEIGKIEPITTGIIINNGAVEIVQVLEFRESRGAEVHRRRFTRQYSDAQLDNKHQLDKRINGISGATLSVNALNRQVRLALLLDQLRREKLQ
ncbi:MAG: FMN-binding protein [Proteobacteria bacterium]|nr:FMN-binding protein [Pseudomonadota bacterium]